MMKLLLSADPAAANAIAKLGEDFEFFDIDAANSEDLAACADLAIAIKKLLTELSEAGPAAVRARLAAVLQREITDDELNALVGGLSVDTLRPAARAWLAQEALAANQPAGNGAAGAGAWFRDDATLSIRYRPAIHADPILTGWLSLLAGVGDLENKPLALALFKEMSRPTAPGLCASCHSVEQSRAGRLAIHWRAADRTKSPRAFTKFSHSPHVLLPELADCTACHTIDSGADTSPSYAGWNATAFTSEFRPIAKQSCAACHTAKGAGDSCQQCHNYHVGGIEDSGFGVESLGLKGDILRGAAANGQSIVPNPQASTLIPQPIKTSSDTRPAPR
jgi:hypothetical protein